MWSHKQIETLIGLYRENPCLYAPKHALYKNRHGRNRALETIQGDMKRLGLEVSIADIKSKWNNIRNNFLAQYRKYIAVRKSGAGDDDVEADRPTLWYFEQMLFLSEHTIPRKSADSITERDTQDEAEPGEDDTQETAGEDPDTLDINEPDEGVEHGEMSDSWGQSQESDEEQTERNEGTSSTRPPKKRRLPTRQSSSEVAGTSSTETPTATAHSSRRRKGKQKKHCQAEDFMATATTALTKLTKSLQEEPPAPGHGEQAKSGIQTFVDFLGTQLEALAANEELLLTTQEKIMNIIWAARRQMTQTNK